MSHVWRSSRHKGSDLLLLLAIADFANDDGVAYPSIKTLAAKTRLQIRNVQYRLRVLQKSQELTILLNAGPHGTHIYKVHVGVQSLQGEKTIETTRCEDGGAIFAPPMQKHVEIGVQCSAYNPSLGDPLKEEKTPFVSTIVETSPPPAMQTGDTADLTEEEKTTTRDRPNQPPKPKRATRCPTDYMPPPSLYQWATKAYPEIDVLLALEAMRDWEYKSPGRSDWDAALRTWIRNEVKYGAGPKTSPPGQSEQNGRVSAKGLRSAQATKRILEDIHYAEDDHTAQPVLFRRLD